MGQLITNHPPVPIQRGHTGNMACKTGSCRKLAIFGSGSQNVTEFVLRSYGSELRNTDESLMSLMRISWDSLTGNPRPVLQLVNSGKDKA